jgi:hypothetical protein
MAAMLLTFITAVTAGFFVYQFMFNLTEKMKTAFPTKPLQLEFDVNCTCITIFARNFASVNVQILEAYVNGKEHNLTEKIIISPGDSGMIRLHGAYAKGEIYTVKITSSLGSALVRDVKYD